MEVKIMEEINLIKLTKEIKTLERMYDDFQFKADDCLIQVGRILIDTKSKLEHGQFENWLENELGYRSKRYWQNLAKFARDYESYAGKLELGYSRMAILVQMDVKPEIREKIVEKVVEKQVTKNELTGVKKQGSVESTEDFEAKFEKAKKQIEKESEKRLSESVNNVVIERNDLEKQVSNLNSQIENLQTELKAVDKSRIEAQSKEIESLTLKLEAEKNQLKEVLAKSGDFEKSIESKASEKIILEREKIESRIKKQYEDKLKIEKETAENRLNEIVELKSQNTESKSLTIQIKNLKDENLSLRTAIEDKVNLIKENEILRSRIATLEKMLASVKKESSKAEIFAVVQKAQKELNGSVQAHA